MQPGDIKAGQWGRIVGLAGQASAYRNRLISMGLLPGVVFQIIRVAPLGDPFELWIQGACLILRRQEAAILSVEPLCQH